jgi:hypothetical protein
MNLRQFMEATKLTPEQVAQKTGMHMSTVYRHLSGVRNVGRQSALRYAKLGMSLEELLQETHGSPTETNPESSQAANV